MAGTILRPSLSSSSIGAKEEQPLLSVQEDDDEEETAAERAESDDEKDGRSAGELQSRDFIVDTSCQSDSRAEARHAWLLDEDAEGGVRAASPVVKPCSEEEEEAAKDGMGREEEGGKQRTVQSPPSIGTGRLPTSIEEFVVWLNEEDRVGGCRSRAIRAC